MRTVHGAEGLRDDWSPSWGESIASARRRLRDAGARPGPVLEELVASVSELVDAPAWVAVRDQFGLICRAASWEVRHMMGRSVPMAGTVCGWVLETAQPYRAHDVLDSSPIGVSGDLPRLPLAGEDDVPPGAAPTTGNTPATGPSAGAARSVLVVPLTSATRTLGVVVLTATEPGWFQDGDTRAVLELAAAATNGLVAANLPPTQPLALAMLYDDLASGTISATDAMLRAEAPLAAAFAPPVTPAVPGASPERAADDPDGVGHDGAHGKIRANGRSGRGLRVYNGSAGAVNGTVNGRVAGRNGADQSGADLDGADLNGADQDGGTWEGSPTPGNGLPGRVRKANRTSGRLIDLGNPAFDGQNGAPAAGTVNGAVNGAVNGSTHLRHGGPVDGAHPQGRYDETPGPDHTRALDGTGSREEAAGSDGVGHHDQPTGTGELPAVPEVPESSAASEPDVPFLPLTELERRIGTELVRERLAARFDLTPATASIPLGPTRVPSTMATPGGLGLWDWDGVSGEVTWSEPVSRLLNLPPDGALSLEAVRAVLHPDEQERFDATVARVGRGEGAAGSLRVIWNNGETRHIYAWGEARRNERGEVVGAWGAVVDVTERAQDAAVLRSSLVGLRAAQQLTGLGVWEWRPDTGQLDWSPEMFRLVGLEPGARDPSISMWHGFVHPEDVDKARRLDVLAAHRDGGSVENFRVIGADGEVRHVQSWSTVVAADDGSPRAVCGATVDVTSQVQDRELLEQLSATDSVTGLGNRLAFDRHMQQVLSDSGKDVAVLLLDLDRFKTVNDSLGHQVGDRLLVEAARRINAVVPEGGITARMGGDEFVVVPRPGLGWLQVRRLAQAIVDALRAPYVLPESGEMLVCPASVGVTSTSGRRVGVSDLLREADLALYRAKDSGRDRFVVFDDVLRNRAQARHRAERELRAALEDGRLLLEYQPIVDCQSGQVIGAEALVRLLGADGARVVEPDAFIDVAEDTGLVVELDCWVIDEAIREIGRWVASGAPHAPWLAINVSARSMEHPRVARRLLEAVGDGRLPLDRIKLELTEHSFLGALPGGESTLRQLLAAGVHVGIDDFGTGYSALAYLQRFDLDFMKIDRSFVADVGRDARADAVVTAIVDLAHAHGMRVTAEGVETAEQAARLCEIGCDYAQGYHFGVPGLPDSILRV